MLREHISNLDTVTVLREACCRHPFRSPEYDVEYTRHAVWTNIGRGTERDNQPGTGGWVTHPHQHRITIITRFAGHIHLRDEPLEAATRDGEMDVRGSAWIRHRPDCEELIPAGRIGRRGPIPLEILIARLIGPSIPDIMVAAV